MQKKYRTGREKRLANLRPGQGRPKGSKNKFTTLKDAFLEAFEKTGGTEGLVNFIKESKHNRALFYGWITKMLPSNVDVNGNLGVVLKVSNDFLPKTK